MLSEPGGVVWPTAVGARTPTATPSDEGQPRAPHLPKGHDTSGAGSESASCKRRGRDQSDHVNDLYDHLTGSGDEDPAALESVAGSNEGKGAKKLLLTTATTPQQVSLSSVCFVCGTRIMPPLMHSPRSFEAFPRMVVASSERFCVLKGYIKHTAFLGLP